MQEVLRHLSTPRPMDFTVEDESGNTILKYLASPASALSDAEALTILRALVQHVERFPRDVIDWGGRDGLGREFITWVAEEQRLSLFYPIIRDIPYYGDRTEPLVLPSVWRWDWEALSAADKEDFSITGARVNNADSKATGQLWKLTMEMGDFEGVGRGGEEDPAIVEELQRCIQRGADVMFDVGDGSPILLTVARYRTTSVIVLCLETKTPLCHVKSMYYGNEEKLRAAFTSAIFSNFRVSQNDRLVTIRALEDHLRRYPAR